MALVWFVESGNVEVACDWEWFASYAVVAKVGLAGTMSPEKSYSVYMGFKSSTSTLQSVGCSSEEPTPKGS